MADVKPSLDTLLSKLWEREEVPEIRASIHYQDHYQRLSDGRYSVSLPRKEHCPNLGASRPTALKRLLSSERSLQRRGKLELFQEVLQEYYTLDHAEEVPTEELEKPYEQHYYLPVHVVFKVTSSTSKTRLVFDASAKTTTGRLLNDTLLPTLSLLPQISSLIASFRTHTVTLTADVGKMFREVALEPQEKDFHRFLARQPDGSIQDRRMTRLIFGVSAYLYLATRIVQQIADDYSQEFPRATVVASNKFYVNDCLTGAESVEAAVELHQAFVKLMDKG